MRKGTPKRVHNIELFLDVEVQEAVCKRFDLLEGLDRDDPFYADRKHIALQSFLGYDYCRVGVEGLAWPLTYHTIDDTAELTRGSGRSFIDEHAGPITNWEEFEAYPWPDPAQISTRRLEWYSKNLPETMCIIGGGGFAHFAEFLTWMMGYETLCIALCEQRDLVAAISNRLVDLFEASLRVILQFDRVKMVWGSDDMGFRNGLLVNVEDTREFFLKGHKLMAKMSHDAGRPYLLHSCGNLKLIMDDLINDVQIDAKHSFEDTIEDVRDLKDLYGDRIAILGGIDMDFLCRADEQAIRRRVRDTLEHCMPGGGYCLGTGNSVANYIPLDNYLAMLDEGRKFTL
jgi:uroporphyrinogen decarboxylase